MSQKLSPSFSGLILVCLYRLRYSIVTCWVNMGPHRHWQISYCQEVRTWSVRLVVIRTTDLISYSNPCLLQHLWLPAHWNMLYPIMCHNPSGRLKKTGGKMWKWHETSSHAQCTHINFVSVYSRNKGLVHIHVVHLRNYKLTYGIFYDKDKL